MQGKTHSEQARFSQSAQTPLFGLKSMFYALVQGFERAGSLCDLFLPSYAGVANFASEIFANGPDSRATI
jgi:hypothetical protein